jgi:hypothetical protein
MTACLSTEVRHPSWCDETACRSLPNGDDLPATVMHRGEVARLSLGEYDLRTCLAQDSDPIDGDAEFVGLLGLGTRPELSPDFSLWLTIDQTQALTDRLQHLLAVARGGGAS